MSFKFNFDVDVDLKDAGEEVEQALNEISELEVGIGFNEKSGSYDDGTSVTMVAAWNEMGTENAPSRPFMRQTVENNEDEIKRYARVYLQDAIKGYTSAKKALELIGYQVAHLMRQEIENGNFEPNAPSTIAKKGSSKPLIDTYKMYSNIIYEVKNN